jgi:hypothetical protein
MKATFSTPMRALQRSQALRRFAVVAERAQRGVAGFVRAGVEGFLHGLAADALEDLGIADLASVVLERADEETLAFRQHDSETIHDGRHHQVAAEPGAIGKFENAEAQVAGHDPLRGTAHGGRSVSL